MTLPSDKEREAGDRGGEYADQAKRQADREAPPEERSNRPEPPRKEKP